MRISLRIITDVNLGDVVEVLDVFLSPIVHQLRSSVDLVVLPSVQKRGEFPLFFVAPLRASMALP